MILIIGLGNPGKKFNNTRHNIGFEILNSFKKNNNFTSWEQKPKFKAKISKSLIENKEIILAKPETFMNSSGKSVKALAIFYKPKTNNIWIVHDDLDITLGKIKISKSKSSAGHKGIESIIKELKTKDFIRFRIGVAIENKKRQETKDKIVLKKFTEKERKVIKKIKKRACDALLLGIEQGIEKTMSEYNN